MHKGTFSESLTSVDVQAHTFIKYCGNANF